MELVYPQTVKALSTMTHIPANYNFNKFVVTQNVPNEDTYIVVTTDATNFSGSGGYTCQFKALVGSGDVTIYKTLDSLHEIESEFAKDRDDENWDLDENTSNIVWSEVATLDSTNNIAEIGCAFVALKLKFTGTKGQVNLGLIGR